MEKSTLENLAERVRSGDPLAAYEMRQALQSPMARILRRALRAGTAATPLVRQLRAEAGQDLSDRNPETETRLARELTEGVIAGLRYRSAARDYGRETVVA
jgi:hypothetical protein